MSQLGRISGQLLKDNLTRQGTDLAFDTDLLYLNVNQRYIGINTDTPSKPLFVNGEFNTTNFITPSVDGISSFNLDFVANNIISQNNLNLIASTFVFADNIRTDNISIDNNSISTLQSNSNLELRPNGTGTVEIQGNTNITGNLIATGSITFDGNIIFGDSDADNVTLLADVNSDIIPDQNNFYNLGTNLKRWEGVYPSLINGQTISSLSIVSGGLDLALRQGNIWYVASNGNDSNVGNHQNGPFATITKALSEASAGDTVHIYPGTYTEITPLTIPAGVTVRGASLRSVNIIPDSTTTSENVFLLNGETTVSDLTIKNFYYDSVNDTGYAFSFAPGFTVTSRSPYVQNITVITQGTTITVDDPRGFASGDAGKGAKIDGSLANAASIEASMLFHSCTFICPGVDAITMLNGVRVEWLNSFTYYANRGLYALNGTAGFANLGLRFGAEVRSIGSASVYGNYGAEANGASTLMYLITHNFAYIGAGKDTTNDPSLNIAANETVELGGGKIYYQSLDNKGNYRVGEAFKVEYETGRVTIAGVGVGAGGVTSINFASGTDETVIDATQVLVNNIRFSNNNLNSIYGDINLDSATNQLNTPNNVTAINDIDITGDFTVDGMLTIGNAFIDVVEFVAPVDFGLRAIVDNAHSLGNSTKRWQDVVVFDSYIGNLKVSDNVITTLDSNADLELRADGTGRIYIPTDNVEFDQNLTVDGTSYTKSISLIGSLNQTGSVQRTGSSSITGYYNQIGNRNITGRAIYGNVEVAGNNVQTLASNSNLVLDPSGTGRIYVPYSDVQVLNDFTVNGLIDGTIAAITTSTTSQTYNNNVIEIGTNIIQTSPSNSDLELRAAGSGRIYIPSNDVQINNSLDVNSITNLSSTNITGTLVQIGTINQTGNTTQLGNRHLIGDITVSSNVDFGDIEFINNRLITTRSNSDLELKTAGTGKIYIPGNNVQVDNDAVVDLHTQANLITVTSSVTSQAYNNSNIEIGTNIIQTSPSNSDLELRAAGTGRIYVPQDNVEIDNDLTVNGTTNLSTTNITGSVNQNGLISRTGNTTQSGNVTIVGSLTAGSVALVNTPLITGTITVGTWPIDNYGYSATFTAGSLTTNPAGMIAEIGYSIYGGGISFYNGTYTGPAGSVTVSYGLINGSNTIYLTIDGITKQITFNGMSWNDSGDSFGLTAKLGQTLNVSISTTLPVAVATTADFGDIELINNRVITTRSNSDLELKTAGTGKIYVPSNNIQVDNDITVVGNTQSNSLNSASVSSTTYSNGNIFISSNIIQTTISNSDLELKTAGTGRIYIPSDNGQINNNLTVNGVTTLANTATENLNQIGTINQTGNTVQFGNRNIDGDLTVSSNVDFGDIEFINNRIITTQSNSNLELRASGTGNIKFVDKLQIDQAANFTTTISSDIANSNTVTSERFYNGNLEIFDNNIRALNSNSDLIFLANNIGTVSMPLDPLVLGQNFTVTLSSTFKNTAITGLLQHIGNTIHTGNSNETGNFNLTGNLSVGTDAYFENINFIDNRITTVNSNSNLELKASGSGQIVINNNLNLGQNLSVTGLLSTVTINNSLLISSEKFVNNDILIQDNFITTTQSNSNLILLGELTGGPRLERIKFNNNTISTTTGNENVVIQGTTNNIIFNTVSAVKLPAGTNLQRPVLTQADLRFNTSETLFNGFSSAKVTFGGVYSANQRTRLTAHPTNNTLNFVANEISTATVSSSGITLNGLSTDNNLLFDTNIISSQLLNSDVFFTTSGTGQFQIGNLGIRDNELNNLNLTQPLILQNTGFGYVEFNGTGGLVIPAGDTAHRPSAPETGDIRWNSQEGEAEVFNGTQYQSFQGDSGDTLTGAEVEDVTNLWALVLG